MKEFLRITLVVLSLASLSACSSSDDDATPPNPGSTDSGSADSGSTDSGSTDSGSTDSGSTDSGSTDSGSTDSGSTDSGIQASCEIIDALQLQNNGGVFSTVLPADLTTAGAQIAIGQIQSGQFTAFDPSSGAIDYVPEPSRLSSRVDYQVSDADGTVLSTHQHRWVFSPLRVMPLGDSITSGVEFFDGMADLPAQAERVGYRKFLFDRLSNDGYSIDYLGQGGQSAGAEAGLADPENNGYPGVDIAFINNKLVELLTEDDVDIILLHIGTNNTPANASEIETLLDTLDMWEAANHPVLALVATIVPKRNAANNEQVDNFNQDLRLRIAGRTGDKVVLVEQNLALTIDDISTEAIGVHPNLGGYEKMANAWFASLTNTDNNALLRCDP